MKSSYQSDHCGLPASIRGNTRDDSNLTGNSTQVYFENVFLYRGRFIALYAMRSNISCLLFWTLTQCSFHNRVYKILSAESGARDFHNLKYLLWRIAKSLNESSCNFARCSEAYSFLFIIAKNVGAFGIGFGNLEHLLNFWVLHFLLETETNLVCLLKCSLCRETSRVMRLAAQGKSILNWSLGRIVLHSADLYRNWYDKIGYPLEIACFTAMGILLLGPGRSYKTIYNLVDLPLVLPGNCLATRPPKSLMIFVTLSWFIFVLPFFATLPARKNLRPANRLACWVTSEFCWLHGGSKDSSVEGDSAKVDFTRLTYFLIYIRHTFVGN